MPIQQHHSFSISIAASPKPFLAKIFSVGAFVACVALVISDSPLKQSAVGAMMDVASSVMVAVNSPVQAAKTIAAETRSLFMLHEENIALKAENEQLRKWQMLASRLDSENQSLRLLMSANTRLEAHYLTARVIHEGFGLNSQSGVLDIGSDAGVQRGQAVMTYDGVVGRVTDVGGKSSRIIYITSSLSNIPVVTGDSASAGILSGRGSSELPIIHYTSTSNIKVGELVTTSGAGGMFQPGLPVGVVKAVGADGTVMVSPLANIPSLDYVTVIESPSIMPPTDPKK